MVVMNLSLGLRGGQECVWGGGGGQKSSSMQSETIGFLMSALLFFYSF